MTTRAPTRGDGSPTRPALSSLWAAVGLDFLVFGLVFPILPLFAHHLGLSTAAIGLLLATYSVAQLFAAPAWGRFSDRRGRRPALLASLLGTALSSGAIALAHSPDLLFLAVALNGASGGSMTVAQAAVTDVVAPADQPRAMGLLGASVAAGFVLGPALATMSAFGGARLPFVVATALAGANFALGLARVPETRVPAAPARPAPAPSAAGARTERRAAMRALLVALGLAGAAFGVFETTFGLVGGRHFGFGEAGTGLAFAFVGVVMVVVQARGVGAVLPRLGGPTTVVVAGATFAVGLVIVGQTGKIAFLALGLALVGIGYGLLTPVLLPAIAQSAAPGRRGAALGRQQAVASLARVAGPLAGGVLLAASGALLTYALAALAVLGALWSLRVGAPRAALRGAASARHGGRARRAGAEGAGGPGQERP